MSTQIIQVSLPSEIIYVSGTVNGVACTWTLVDSWWQTTADRAADDKYVVVLTAVNAAGTSATYTLTLYYGILNLITDRTAADVSRVLALAAKGWAGMTAAERTEWQGELKGAYNASDMNRVGAAVQYLAERFTEQGYAVAVAPKTDWLESDTPTAEEFAAYLADVAALRDVIAVKPTTPALPETMAGLTVGGANAIEQTLIDLDALLTNAARGWYFSGELYAAEV